MENTVKYNHKPTYGESLGNGWNVMGDQFLVLFLVVIILAVLDGPASFPKVQYNIHDWSELNMHSFLDHLPTWGAWFATLGLFATLLALIAMAYRLLIMPIFSFGAKMMFVQAARGQRPDFATLVQGFKENYLYIILANLLSIALIMIGFFALIIPGIIIACRLVFVAYLVMDKKLDPIMAVEESWRMTKGHGWTIFFMGLTSFFICLFGLILLIVGILPAIIWVKSSFACLYEALQLERAAKTDS
jgi:hypothetical protein